MLSTGKRAVGVPLVPSIDPQVKDGSFSPISLHDPISSHLWTSSFLLVWTNIIKLTLRKVVISYYELEVGCRW